MRKIKFNIGIYNWDITVIDVEEYNRLTVSRLKKFLQDLDMNNDSIDYVLEFAKDGMFNGGYHNINKYTLESLIVIYPQENKKMWFNTMNHEKRHLIDSILNLYNIHDDEASACLDGYVSEFIYQLL